MTSGVDLPFRVGALGDFRWYTGSDPWMSREWLLARAAQPLAAGQQCLTLMQDEEGP